jgi:hypothetical protein
MQVQEGSKPALAVAFSNWSPKSINISLRVTSIVTNSAANNSSVRSSGVGLLDEETHASTQNHPTPRRLNKSSNRSVFREEYVLTSDSLSSRRVKLNGGNWLTSAAELIPKQVPAASPLSCFLSLSLSSHILSSLSLSLFSHNLSALPPLRCPQRI